MKKIIVQSIHDSAELATRLARMIKPGMLLTMKGDLGAGKTTFTKTIGRELGVKKTINSPTFTILKIYKGEMPLYHMDAYRLENISQDLGFDEYYEGDGLCIVEWPDYIEEQLPKERLEISIHRIEDDTNDELRIFEFEAIGRKYQEIVEALS